MAVSKRTRFEVLRRDNYTCRYCRSSENTLTIDHVTPVALGGTDEPSNLVAACKDCNSGKGSTSPDEGTVANVEADELRWVAAIKKAAMIRGAVDEEHLEVVDRFATAWDDESPPFATVPSNWRESIVTFAKSGLTADFIERAVSRASNKQGLPQRETFRYFCGICWAEVRELRSLAIDLLAVQEG